MSGKDDQDYAPVDDALIKLREKEKKKKVNVTESESGQQPDQK
ncbi:MAG: hypothetical protein ABSF82_02720 [Candidatus Bathyarchaeia archaeon]